MCTRPDAIISAACAMGGAILAADSGWPSQKPRMVMGLKTVNIVRRPELVDELQAIGGDVVVVDSPDVSEKIKAAVGQA